MFEVFILSVFACSADPMSVEECGAYIGRTVHETEESCVIELIEQATPFFSSEDMTVTGFSCGPYDSPVNVGEPT